MNNALSKTHFQTYLGVFLVGMLCLTIELVHVRMFSFFLGTISNFLAIPIALLGLAVGSVYCHFFNRRDPRRLIRLASIALYWVVLGTFVLFFVIANRFFSDIHMVYANPVSSSIRLLVYSALFLPTYFVFGVLLTSYFSTNAERIGRLYFYDLVGAALGCLVASLLFTYTDLYVTILIVIFGAFLLLLSTPMRAKTAVVGAAAVIYAVAHILAFNGQILRERPNPDLLSRILFGQSEAFDREEVAVAWNHLARVSLVRRTHKTKLDDPRQFVIVQDDGISNVRVVEYAPGDNGEKLLRHNVHHVLPHLLGRSPENILVVFAGSGRDMIWLNQFHGTAEITGVELNPLVQKMALHPATSGFNLRHFFAKDNIHFVNREGRDFLNNSTEKFDLVLAATNGAVFAGRVGHTRKYLDTYEACRAYLDHLTDDGMIIFVNQPIERKLESFKALFDARGQDFSRAVYAYGRRGSHTIQSAVIKPSGLTRAETDILRRHIRAARPNFTTYYNPHAKNTDRRFVSLVEEPLHERGGTLVVDDKPFIQKIDIAGFELFPNETKLKQKIYASSWIKIITVLVFGALSLGLILAAWRLGPKDARLPLRWLFYFFVSGIAYMGVEIGLIGKIELFMGGPLYAVAVILASFLMSNGIGAYLQERFAVFKGPLTMIGLTALSLAWGVLCVTLFNTYLLSIAIPLKVLLVFVGVMPSGVCLGMYYPLGVATLVKQGRGAAVPVTYGAATLSSVFGSALAMTLIVSVGFSNIIIAGGVGYLIVAGVFGTISRRVSAR